LANDLNPFISKRFNNIYKSNYTKNFQIKKACLL
jgi:hypothetical protein